MAHSNLHSFILLVALTTAIQPAYAQQPPDTVKSDLYGNTASGTSALLNVQGGSGGTANDAFGQYALMSNTTGNDNTAVGNEALMGNTTGYFNTAIGSKALFSNTTGNENTASGAGALRLNTTGTSNTATGNNALFSNTSGNLNAAFGKDALNTNTTGNYNTAVGGFALSTNTTGYDNTAVGQDALLLNTTGANNTAFGNLALQSNTTGKGNAAQGVNSLFNNTSGIRNVGIGNNALFANSIGSYNIALGFDAGYNVANGSNNIEIGSMGTPSDNGTIQIGVQGTQTLTMIAGIFGTPVSGSAVYVTSTGQLGVQASSERFKTDVATMPELSGKLAQLRPVTFHYKTDPKSVQQYGLIAEEVDRVYPELVIRDGAGRIQGVHYEELAPMLLSELQQQRRIIAAQTEHAAFQDAEVRALKRQVAELIDRQRDRQRP